MIYTTEQILIGYVATFLLAYGLLKFIAPTKPDNNRIHVVESDKWLKQTLYGEK